MKAYLAGMRKSKGLPTKNSPQRKGSVVRVLKKVGLKSQTRGAEKSNVSLRAGKETPTSRRHTARSLAIEGKELGAAFAKATQRAVQDAHRAGLTTFGIVDGKEAEIGSDGRPIERKS